MKWALNWLKSHLARNQDEGERGHSSHWQRHKLLPESCFCASLWWHKVAFIPRNPLIWECRFAALPTNHSYSRTLKIQDEITSLTILRNRIIINMNNGIQPRFLIILSTLFCWINTLAWINSPPNFCIWLAISQDTTEPTWIIFSALKIKEFRSPPCEFHWNQRRLRVCFLPPYPARLFGKIRWMKQRHAKESNLHNVIAFILTLTFHKLKTMITQMHEIIFCMDCGKSIYLYLYVGRSMVFNGWWGDFTIQT